VAARRAELRQTLAAAPPALATLRSFLGRLQDATVPLGPAADKLAATAGPLLQVQAALPGFTAAARPTLDTAAAVAPSLTRLANGATPVLRRSIPALAQLRRTSVNDIPGVAKTLNGSIYNVVAVLENWSRAIQYRDGLSHIFRGEGSFATNTITSAINRLVPGLVPARKRATGGTHQKPSAPAPTPQQQQNLSDLVQLLPLDSLLGNARKGLDDTVKQVTDGLNKSGTDTQNLLDYLLRP
jgi:phospholipid/cholesterol/gamma-HCH transport system substrate-binding protein